MPDFKTLGKLFKQYQGESLRKRRISNFLWKEEKTFTNKKYSQHFRRDGFGNYVLKRVEVMEKIMKARDEQLLDEPSNSASVYLTGCRGMGKTSDLMLVARVLKSKGFEVYWFECAQAIPVGMGTLFKDYASQNKNKNIAVLVDEVATNPNSDLFTALLKDAPENVLTIGASVPRFLSMGGANFRTVLRTSDLVLNKSDQDVVGLIEHWKGLNVTKPDVVQFVCDCLLDHCGGHVYPVLAFMEYFFTNEEAKKHLGTEADFCTYFTSPDFATSAVNKEVFNRCFDSLSLDPLSAMVAARVLGGQAEGNDIETMTNLGWWDPEKRDVLSTLLLQKCAETNSLYQGITRAPVVTKLPCPNPPIRINKPDAVRGYCSVVERMGALTACSRLSSTMARDTRRVLLRGFTSCLKKL